MSNKNPVAKMMIKDEEIYIYNEEDIDDKPSFKVKLEDSVGFIPLVDPSDKNASNIMVSHDGDIKALAKKLVNGDDAGSSTINTSIVTDNLVGYWNSKQGVEGNIWRNIAPETAGQYDAHIFGATATEDGMYFDGVDDFVSMYFTNTTNWNEITFEFAIHLPRADQPDEYSDILVFYDGNFYTSGHRRETIDFWFEGGDGQSFNFNSNIVNFYTFTINNDGNFYIYENGALKRSGAYDSNTMLDFVHFDLGERWDYRPKGIIDCVRIYNRALTPEEIQQNYAVRMEVGLEVIEYTEPPNKVSDLKVLNKTTSSAKLSWTASNSEGVVLYDIYRDNIYIATTYQTNYDVKWLSASTTYVLTVYAKHNDELISDGVSVSVTTNSLTTSIVTDGLVGYWNSKQGVEGNTWRNIVSDTSHTIHLTDVQDHERGLLFNSTSSHGLISVPDEFHTIGQSYSIEVLFTPMNIDFSSYENIFSEGNITLIGSDYLWSESYRADNHRDYINTTHQINYNELSQLVVVYSANDNMMYSYINGVLTGSSTMSEKVKWVQGEKDVYLCKETESERGLQGYIHSIRMYSKELTAIEVSQNYSVGREVGLGETSPPIDITPPAEITNLNTTETTDSISFTFTNPTDDDFDKVNIYRDSVLVGSTNTGTFDDVGLSPDTDYSYLLTTVDNVGNESSGVAIQASTKTFSIESPTNKIVTNGLVGYWNSRQGVESNIWENIAPATIGQYNASILGATHTEEGIHLDGLNDVVSLTIPTELRTVGSPYSIEMLFTNQDISIPRQLIGTGTWVSVDEWGAWFEHYESSSWESGIGHEVDFSKANDELVYFTITYNPTIQQVKYYIDGQLVNSEIVSNPIKWAYGNEITIGYYEYGDPAFKGILHGVRLYSGTLTEEEILHNYDIGLNVGLGDDPIDPIDPIDYEYTVSGGNVTITNYIGADTDIVIPDEIDGSPVKIIGANAFLNKQLTSVVIPSTITDIEERAFEGNQLISIVLPSNLRSIGLSGFAYNNLTSLVMPNSITNLGEQVFRGNQIESVIISSGLTSISSGLLRDNNLTNITIPENIITIESSSLRDNNLTSIVIPENVLSIASNSFVGNNIKEVRILNSLTEILTNPFSGNQTNPIDLIIYGHDPSTAKTYANQFGYTFIALEGLLPQNVQARIYMNGTVQVKGELIERQDGLISFDSNGNFYASEFIETNEGSFSISPNGIVRAHRFIEDKQDQIESNLIPNILHLNGAEYGVYDYTGATNTFSNQNRGVLGTDYHYEGQGFLNHIASRGWTIVKIPIRWERIQSTINGNLNPTELGYLRSFMNRCHNAGLKVIIDVHNYGIYYLHESGMGRRKVIGSADLPISAFADLWTRLTNEFHDHPAIFGYAIMAEPQNAGGLTRGVWENASQQAVNAIRQIDTKSEIHVSGWSWGSVPDWTSSNASTPWITDNSGGIIRYEGHHYFDRDASGNYERSYSSEVSDAISKGFTKDGNKDELITKTFYDIQGYVNWLENNNVLGIIGETGWLPNDANWMFLGEKYLEELKRLNIPVTAWSAGEWTDDYYLSIYGGTYPNIVTSLSAQVWESSL